MGRRTVRARPRIKPFCFILGLPAEFGFDSTTFLPIVGTSTFSAPYTPTAFSFTAKGPSRKFETSVMLTEAAPNRDRVNPKPYTLSHCVAFSGGAPSTMRGPRTSLKSEKGTKVGPPTPSGPPPPTPRVTSGATPPSGA